MKQNKKSQGISITTIIIAAVALIVLIVLIAIFSGKIRLFGSEVTSTQQEFSAKKCELPGTLRRCETRHAGENAPCSEGGTYIQNTDCPNERPVCCGY